MATGYEKINNIKNILCKPMTVESLAISLNCKPRTIYRHIQQLEKEMSDLRLKVADISDNYVEITKYIARKPNGGGNLGNYEDYQSQDK